MAGALLKHGVRPLEPSATDDPVHDPLLFGIGIAIFLGAVLILALTGVFHAGVE